MSYTSTAPQLSELRYRDLHQGQRFAPVAQTLDQATSDAVRGAIGTPAPGSGAPLGVLPLVALRVCREVLVGIPPGGILTNLRLSVIAPLPAAAELTVHTSVSDQARRPSGLYTTLSFAFEHAGAIVATVDWTVLAAPEEDEDR
jgi:hypothetical protein